MNIKSSSLAQCITFSIYHTDKEPITKSPADVLTPKSPFCLLLRNAIALSLGPKSTVDIPVSFAPEDMRRFDSYITVSMQKEDGAPWDYNLREER